MPWQNVVAVVFQAGNTFVINPNGMFVYNGVPAAHNLINSITPAAGIDPFGNYYLQGETTYHYLSGGPSGSIAININDAAVTWYVAASGTLGPWSKTSTINNYNIANGLVIDTTAGGISEVLLNTDVAKWNNPLDQRWTLGHQIVIANGATTINSTTPIQIANLTANVGAGLSYRLKCYLRCVAGSSGTAQVMVPQISGTCTMTSMRVFVNEYAEVGGTTINPSTYAGLNADPAVLPGVIANNTVFDWVMEGTFTVNAAGSLFITGRVNLSAADESFTVQGLSFMELSPM